MSGPLCLLKMLPLSSYLRNHRASSAVTLLSLTERSFSLCQGNTGELMLLGTPALGPSVPEWFCPCSHGQSVPQNFLLHRLCFCFQSPRFSPLICKACWTSFVTFPCRRLPNWIHLNYIPACICFLKEFHHCLDAVFLKFSPRNWFFM